MKKIFKLISVVTISLFFLCGAGSVCADAKENTLSEIKTIQEGILSWKLEKTGQETILSGETLDQAGQSGSDWYAFAGSRMGAIDGQEIYLSRLRDYVEYLYANLDEKLPKMNATEWHRIALTAAACGADPTSFGVDVNGNPINLVADGTWNCLKGDPGKQGINGYAWALYLMDSNRYEVPADASWTREKIVDAILEKQYEDGGFALGNAESSDADITSIVLTALAPYAEDPEVQAAAEAAFARLSAIQQADGTMVTYGERTSESTAWTLIALSSWNRDPFTDELFIKEGNTLYDGLKLFMLKDGSFIHSLDGVEKETEGNYVSTYQILYALEAVSRQAEGKNHLFDLTDADTISQEQIDAAKEQLPKLSYENEKKDDADIEEEAHDGVSRVVIASVAAAVIVITVVIFASMILREKKKGKKEETVVWDDDDEW